MHDSLQSYTNVVVQTELYQFIGNPNDLFQETHSGWDSSKKLAFLFTFWTMTIFSKCGNVNISAGSDQITDQI